MKIPAPENLTGDVAAGYIAACIAMANAGALLIRQAPSVTRPENARANFNADLKMQGETMIWIATEIFTTGTGRPAADLLGLINIKGNPNAKT